LVGSSSADVNVLVNLAMIVPLSEGKLTDVNVSLRVTFAVVRGQHSTTGATTVVHDSKEALNLYFLCQAEVVGFALAP
jgi:hypothetical protein